MRRILVSVLAVVLGAAAWADEPAPATVREAVLGCETRTPSKDEVKAFALTVLARPRGRVVTTVAEGSAAAKGGLGVGDVLVAIDDHDLYSQDDLDDALRARVPGAKAALSVLRKDTAKAESLAVELGSCEVKAPAFPRIAWELAGLARLPAALALARERKQFVVVGLAGAET